MPIKVFDGLPAARQAGVCFSPDESLIVTGEYSSGRALCTAWSYDCMGSCTHTWPWTSVLHDAGTEAARDGTGAALYFFDRQRNELVRRVGMDASVSALLWHERLNQIFVGTGVQCRTGIARHLASMHAASSTFSHAAALVQATGRSAGPRFCMILPTASAACYYQPHAHLAQRTHLTSRQGSPQRMTTCSKRTVSFTAIDLGYMSHLGCSVLQLPLVIKTPHALPMYREDQGKGRKRPHEREADEAVRTRRPDPGGGIAGLGLGKGGKLGATGGTLLTQYILQNQVGRCTVGGLHVFSLESGL